MYLMPLQCHSEKFSEYTSKPHDIDMGNVGHNVFHHFIIIVIIRINGSDRLFIICVHLFSSVFL